MRPILAPRPVRQTGDAGALVVELRNAGRSFAGVRALDGVDLRVHAGTIHALVGENGAGKSTLGRIVGGAVTVDTGEVLVDGRPVSYGSPREALDDGIAVIQQEPSLVPHLSVLENVLLGAPTARAGIVDKRAMHERFRHIAEQLPFELDPGAPVASLSIADQQKVEISRALARDARLIVMDEPTSSLGREDTRLLHDVVRHLARDRGTAIVYVSHFLEEILELADRFTVLRNGRLVETFDAEDASIDRLVQGMLGRAVSGEFPAKAPPGPEAPVALSVRGLCRAPDVEPVDLDVRQGEIVGLAGLVGSGRTELARLIFGADKADAGEVRVAGRPLAQGRVKAAIRAGVAMVPEDRAAQGLLLGLSQQVNVSLAHPERFSRWGVPHKRAETAEVRQLLERLHVDPVAPNRAVAALSGGNQQKVLFARWLVEEPKVLLLDEPTRGVDIGAKLAIYELIAALAQSGIAIVVISSEAEEVIGLAHRVLVMRRGRIEASLEGDAINMDRVMEAALGVGPARANGGAA